MFWDILVSSIRIISINFDGNKLYRRRHRRYRLEKLSISRRAPRSRASSMTCDVRMELNFNPEDASLDLALNYITRETAYCSCDKHTGTCANK